MLSVPTSSNVNEKLSEGGFLSYLRKNLPDCAASQLFPPGVQLFQQDEVANEVWLMETGLVKLTRSECNGREFIVCLRSAGSLLGSSTVVSTQRHPFCAITVTPCRLLQIAKVQFIDLLEKDQEVGSFMHKRLGQEVSELMINLTHLACIPVQQRLQQLLWQLSSVEHADHKVGTRFRLPLRYWEVAELLAVTPAYLTRLFVELESAGLLHRSKGWIKIPSPDSLWHEPALAHDTTHKRD
jgi:CRP-like cAMP-binding protein